VLMLILRIPGVLSLLSYVFMELYSLAASTKILYVVITR
jgi:hypothetical protein